MLLHKRWWQNDEQERKRTLDIATRRPVLVRTHVVAVVREQNRNRVFGLRITVELLQERRRVVVHCVQHFQTTLMACIQSTSESASTSTNRCRVSKGAALRLAVTIPSRNCANENLGRVGYDLCSLVMYSNWYSCTFRPAIHRRLTQPSNHASVIPLLMPVRQYRCSFNANNTN
jgi:hypothetical protein